jgi:hypothetical protein
MARKPSETVQVNLRLKESMRRRLEHEAAKHGISLNGEMNARIAASFEQNSLRQLDEIADKMGEVQRYMGAAVRIIETETILDLNFFKAFEALVVKIEAMPDRELIRAELDQVKSTIKTMMERRVRAYAGPAEESKPEWGL